MSAKRLRLAATKIHETVKIDDNGRGRCEVTYDVAALRSLGFDRGDVALAVADLMEQAAEDHKAGVGWATAAAADAVADAVLGGDDAA